MLRRLRPVLPLAAVVLANGFVAAGEGGEVRGRICVAPVPGDAMDLDAETGNRRGYGSYEFSVRIDRREWVRVPTDEPRRIEGIELGKEHLVSIRQDDRLIESFWFTFEDRGGPDQCLWYGPWHQAWVLEPPGNRLWCQCGE